MVRVARYLAGNFEARDSPRCNGGRRSTFAGNSALLPCDDIDFMQCCPLIEFGGKQFHC